MPVRGETESHPPSLGRDVPHHMRLLDENIAFPVLANLRWKLRGGIVSRIVRECRNRSLDPPRAVAEWIAANFWYNTGK